MKMHTLASALLVLLLCSGFTTALTVSPLPGTYTSPVGVNITTDATQDSITFSVGDINSSCINCTELSQSVNLAAGEHTLFAVSELNGTNETANSTFTIQPSFDLEIYDPNNETYNTSSTSMYVVTTAIVDTIKYQLDGDAFVQGCANCSSYNNSISAAAGAHTLTVRATLGDIVKDRSVTFGLTFDGNVTNGTNITNGNATNITRNTTNVTGNTTPVSNGTGPRFTLGLNKLPQQVETGNITDAQLAQIIRDNKLNPGIINRLIKTGKLGNDSISAIIETQKTPPGIWGKIVGFFGIHVNTAKENLAETYDLTAEQAAQLAEDPDVRPEIIEKIEAKIKQRVEEGKKIPPGLAKKLESTDNETNSTDAQNKPTGKGKPENVGKNNSKSENGQGRNK
jgi:hypothetical protein